MSGPTGPTRWESAYFADDNSPSLVIGGWQLDIPPNEDGWEDSLQEAGTFVETGAGQHARHSLVEGQLAPISLATREISVSWQANSETQWRKLQVAAAMVRSGLGLWLDIPFSDAWITDGAATTYRFSRRAGWASTGVDFAKRPARVRKINGNVEIELDVVAGAPTAGQVQIATSTDAELLVTGDVLTAGTILQMVYYPIIEGAVSLSSSGGGLQGELTIEIDEKLESKVLS